MNNKQYDSARIYYHKAISIDPKFTDAYNNLGLLFESQNQSDSAKYYYYKAISIEPKYRNAYYWPRKYFYE